MTVTAELVGVIGGQRGTLRFIKFMCAERPWDTYSIPLERDEEATDQVIESARLEALAVFNEEA